MKFKTRSNAKTIEKPYKRKKISIGENVLWISSSHFDTTTPTGVKLYPSKDGCINR